MIMAYDATDRIGDYRAASHPYDLTIRPQVVSREWNPSYYALLECFERLTGRGIILNTSFNLHGRPIVSYPEDALKVFDESGLENLAIGGYLLRKEGGTAPHQAAEASCDRRSFTRAAHFGDGMKISVVIPTHNRSDALAKTLLKLSEQQFTESWELIVVNNRCDDDTDEVVRRRHFPAPLRLIHEEKPGVAAARNAGIAVARGRHIILLDNDILVEPDFLRRHYDLLLANPGCWIMGQVVNLPEQGATPFGKYRQSLYGYIPRESAGGEAYWLAGSNISLPRSDWERLGGFDERFSGA